MLSDEQVCDMRTRAEDLLADYGQRPLPAVALANCVIALVSERDRLLAENKTMRERCVIAGVPPFIRQ